MTLPIRSTACQRGPSEGRPGGPLGGHRVQHGAEHKKNPRVGAGGSLHYEVARWSRRFWSQAWISLST